MARPILVGYDAKTSDRAPAYFGALLARLTGARLIVVSIHAGPKPLALSAGHQLPFAIVDVDEDLLPDCGAELAQLHEDLGAEGLTLDCRPMVGTSAAHGLHEAAESENAALVVIGSSGRAERGRILPGSTAERVVAGAPCPVAVVPRGWGPSGRIDTIGVGFEDTEEAREALRAAYALARRAGAALRVLAVVKPRLLMSLETKPDVAGKFGKDVEDVMGEHRVRAEKTAREALAQLGDDAHGEVEGSVDDPADTLIRVSQHVDLLVCGSRSYGPLRAVMLGGVTRRVVTEARCPVIVLPRGVESALEDLLARERAAAPV